jgi:type I restriction enzyme S subunit
VTPSKDEPLFWDGEIPWVSPKDMKVLRIVDSEDRQGRMADRMDQNQEIVARYVDDQQFQDLAFRL